MDDKGGEATFPMPLFPAPLPIFCSRGWPLGFEQQIIRLLSPIERCEVRWRLVRKLTGLVTRPET